MTNITIEQFADSFGINQNELPVSCLDYIKTHNFNYITLDKQERDNLILAIIRRIDSDQQVIGAPKRTDEWENGWAYNLKAFRESNHNMNSLIPKFIRPGQCIRFMGDYILPENSNFEYDYMTVFRLWLFEKYFKDFQYVHEFGCGTGLNLVLLNKIFPNKEFHGLDFVKSAVDLVNEISHTQQINIHGHLFDMLNPDYSYPILENSVVMTFGAIEQLASKIEPMINFLLIKKPKLVVHIEPTIELYDPNTLFDHLAMAFHKKRGYTQGLLPRIQELDASGKAKLLKVKRLNFGSLFMEGYMYYIWQPV